jgi:hypothetical protein
MTSHFCLQLTTAEPGHLHYDADYFISLVFLTQMRGKTFTGKILSQVSMHNAFLPLSLLGTVNFMTVGSCIILNQVVAGSTMVRRINLYYRYL